MCRGEGWRLPLPRLLVARGYAGGSYRRSACPVNLTTPDYQKPDAGWFGRWATGEQPAQSVKPGRVMGR